jgi:hypothetical protein
LEHDIVEFDNFTTSGLLESLRRVRGEEYGETFIGKEFSVYLPLDIRGQKKEYSFKFKINVSRIMPD